MALALYRPLLWIVLVATVLLLLWIARRARLRWWPAWLLRSALALMVLVGIFSPRGEFAPRQLNRPQVMVVDQSDSLDPGEREQSLQKARTWQAAEAGRMLVVFADQAQALLPGSPNPPALDSRATDLPSALNLAGDLLSHAPGEVLLDTDGILPSTTAVEAALSQLVQKGHTLQFIRAQARQQPADGSLRSLQAPPVVWEGSDFGILDQVVPPQPGEAVDLQLKIDEQVSQQKGSQMGENLYSFLIPPQRKGLVTIQVSASFGGQSGPTDPFPANNSAYAAIHILPAPKVLVVTRQTPNKTASIFTQVLQSKGLAVDLIPSEELPSNLEQLKNYQVIFLHNILASSISQEQMQALRVFVSKQGGGLVFLGGRSSFTLGGYKNTPFEAMLPVKLEPPPRSQKPPVVFLLVLDRSGSMGSVINLLREAAMRSIEILKPTDFLGVLTFSDISKWEQHPGPVGDGLVLRETLDTVSKLYSTGGTKMLTALQDARIALLELPGSAPAQRHLLLLSDGHSDEGKLSDFKQMAAALAAENTTISTIGLGYGADRDTLAAIALVGKGRYHEVLRASDLPRTMTVESQAAHSENIQQGSTSLKAVETGHPILSGIAEAQLPVLTGYNALTSKADEGAEDVLLSASFGDPLLSVWQYGLGRVTAWMGDLGEEWTQSWDSPDDQALFWSQVVRYTLPGPALQGLQASVQVSETDMTVEAYLQNTVGLPINLADLVFSYASADGKLQSYELPQVEAGLYRLRLSRPNEGAYRALVEYQTADGQKIEAPLPFAVNPPVEWMPMDAQAGQANLENWAAQTGGKIVGFQDLVAGQAPTARPATAVENDWWWWLLLVLIASWPLEIALRRRWLPWI